MGNKGAVGTSPKVGMFGARRDEQHLAGPATENTTTLLYAL